MQRSPELEQLVAGWFQAASRGDASLVDAHVSLDDDVRLDARTETDDGRPVGCDPTVVDPWGCSA